MVHQYQFYPLFVERTLCIDPTGSRSRCGNQQPSNRTSRDSTGCGDSGINSGNHRVQGQILQGLKCSGKDMFIAKIFSIKLFNLGSMNSL